MKKEIVVPVINSEYKVIVCWGNPKEVEKIVKQWGHKPEDIKSSLANRRGVCFYSEDCHPIIALPRYPKTAEEIGTLAHEATHAVINVFAKIDEQNYDEVFAHSVGAVVREVLKSLSPEKSKNQK